MYPGVLGLLTLLCVVRTHGISYLSPQVPYILSATGNIGGQVIIKVPWKNDPSTITLTDSYTHTFSVDMVAVPGDIQNNSILIETDLETARFYGQSYGGPFNLLPVDSLGTEYTVSTCDSPGATNVLTVATHGNESDVQISLNTEGVVMFKGHNYTNEDIIETHLEAYQTLSISSEFDLSGSSVMSSSSIGVFVGKIPRGQRAVKGYMQLPPRRACGKTHIYTTDFYSPQFPNYFDSYMLNIVRIHRKTTVKFSDGPTVTFTKDVYKTELRRNRDIFFESSEPVLATMCSDKSESLVPSTLTYTKESVLFYTGDVVKIITFKDNDVEVRRSSSLLQVSWSGVEFGMFKVGTFLPERSSFPSTLISSAGEFNVVVYNHGDIINGGMCVPPSRKEEKHYNRPTQAPQKASPPPPTSSPSTEISVGYYAFFVMTVVFAFISLFLLFSNLGLSLYAYYLKRLLRPPTFKIDWTKKYVRHGLGAEMMEEEERKKKEEEERKKKLEAQKTAEGGQQKGSGKVEVGKQKSGESMGFSNKLYGMEPAVEDNISDEGVMTSTAFSNKLYEIV